MESINRELAKRLTTALLGIPLMLFVFYRGGIYLFALLCLISAIGMWEYSKILLSKDIYRIMPKVLISLAFFLNTILFRELDNTILFSFFLMFMLMLLSFIISHLKRDETLSSGNYGTSMLGWIYTGVFPGLIYKISAEFPDQQYLLLLIILIWITDSAAYFIGIRYGKHKGIFKVSPNKSLEGFLAGFIAPFIFAVLIQLLFNVANWTIMFLIAFCAGLVGQFGDLLESKIKRIGGVKDSGVIIHGHGGVLDRFDSLLLAGPVLYILLNIIS